MLYARIDAGGRTVSVFSLLLQDATRNEEIADTLSFVGRDGSGSFGLMAGHADFMTCLEVGLARFRTRDRGWRYLALPGGVLTFSGNRLTLSTRHYLIDDDYHRISEAVSQQLLAEEEALKATRQNLRLMEQAVLKRLWESARRGEM